MYCPGCGTETTQGLNYCKQCGASLATTPLVYRPGKPPAWLVLSFLAAIVPIGVLGLVGPLAGSNDLIHSGFSPKEVMLLCLAVMTGAVLMIAFLGKLFFRLLAMYTGSQAEPVAQIPNRTAPASPRRLGPPPTSIASVTEQTTRSFDRPDYASEQSEEKAP
jgi:hypothetical protein